jgi:glycosyltransferase involved in cell wall biosynthesis
MRILHVANQIRNRGNGIVNVLVDLACTQQRERCTVAVASMGGEFEELLTQHGVLHFKLDQSRSPVMLAKAAIRFRGIVAEFRPDIVHAHMMTGAVLAFLLRGRRRYRLVTTVHNEFQRSARLMGVADRVIAVSDAVARSMARRGVDPQRIRVVKNGTLGSPRTANGSVTRALNLHRPAVITVAGMYVRKGIGTLLDAFAHVLSVAPEAHLYLVGDGPDRMRFEHQAQHLRISDRVHFEGFQRNPRTYLDAADVFVLASFREPFALVLPEARDAGLPIIASSVDGNPEALEQGAAGILIPAGDAPALAEAIARLLADPVERSLWAARARHNIEWLTVDRVNRDTIAVYREVLEP